MNKKFLKTTLVVIVILVLTILFVKPTIKEITYGLDFKGGFEVLYKIENLESGKEVTDDMMKSTYKSLVNRIDTLGVSEPEISIEGENIRIKLPGVKSEEEARTRLSTPAVLSFRNTSDELLMTASVLKNPGAKVDFDNKTSMPVVALAINDNKTFYNVTKKISESSDQTIVIWLDFVEGVDSYAKEKDKCGKDGNMKCISSATVSEAFMNNVVIQGRLTEEDAGTLTDLINSGSLPTKLNEVSTRTVGASLGDSTIKTIFYGFIISIILISLILIIKYRFSGLISSICLLVYTVFTLIVFNKIGGVLTLPGIAAMILGIGMAVDSTIISIERIKDEVKNKKSLKEAFNEGNKRSLIAIIDANITTFLAAVILFMFGESSVKGFATMLIITIIITIITMVYLSRFLLKEFIKSEAFDSKKVSFFGKNSEYKKFDFFKNAKYFIAVATVIVLMGTTVICFKGLNLGIDFKGGSLVTVTSTQKLDKTLIKENLYQYKIDNEEEVSDNEVTYRVKNTILKDDINEIKNNLNNYDVDIISVSSEVKKDLTKNAFISLIYACIGIIIYVAIRFSFNYGIASICALIHDTLMVIMLFAITRTEINFIFVASILTIIGYSINDTIVLFDRVRENKKLVYKNNIKNDKELKELINKSNNETISRNIWTTVTTMTTLIVLMCLNINELFGFNLSLLIGLIAGALSSLFIAPYIYYLLERKVIKNGGKKKYYDDELDEKVIKGINS